MQPKEKRSQSHADMPERLKGLKPSIVLIDDCEDFCRIMEAESESLDVKLTSYLSLADMYTFTKLGQYDLALVDYHLEAWTGIEIARYVEIFFPDIPVILISGDQLSMNPNWPDCIKGVLCKSLGTQALLKHSLEIYYQLHIYSLLAEMAVSGEDSTSSKNSNMPHS